jgi:phage recombination protein Bet
MSDLALKHNEIDMALVARTVAKGCSSDELQLFAAICKRTGLDPFARQIYAIKRGGVMTTQVSIDGARLVAQRSGEYAGQVGPFWCGADGVWVDVWLAKTPPLAAKVGVHRRGFEQTLFAVAIWSEYAQTQGNMWAKFPSVMLAKCAEMIALRRAFPAELSGLYSTEEMSQADDHQSGHGSPIHSPIVVSAPQAQVVAAKRAEPKQPQIAASVGIDNIVERADTATYVESTVVEAPKAKPAPKAKTAAPAPVSGGLHHRASRVPGDATIQVEPVYIRKVGEPKPTKVGTSRTGILVQDSIKEYWVSCFDDKIVDCCRNAIDAECRMQLLAVNNEKGITLYGVREYLSDEVTVPAEEEVPQPKPIDIDEIPF